MPSKLFTCEIHCPCPHTMAKAEKESTRLHVDVAYNFHQWRNLYNRRITHCKWNNVLPATGASAAAGAAPAAAATTAPPDGTDANFLEPATSQRRWFYFQGCVTIKTTNLSYSTVWQQTGALTNWHYSPCATVHMLLNLREILFKS